MMTIVPKWGAMYLVTDENYKVDPVTLASREGITLTPGESVTKIGKKARTSFELNNPHTMTYEGVLKVGNTRYAIFKSSGFDKEIGNLFDQELTYRYAFALIKTHGKFRCLYIDSGRGGREVIMDFKEVVK